MRIPEAVILTGAITIPPAPDAVYITPTSEFWAIGFFVTVVKLPTRFILFAPAFVESLTVTVE